MEQTLGIMDRVGVDAAIIVSPWSVYRFDATYALEVASTAPARFRVVVPVDPTADDALSCVDELQANPMAVGLRLVVVSDRDADLVRSGAADSVLALAEATGQPVCVACQGRLGVVADIAPRFAGLPIVVDHLGLEQPLKPPVPREPFRNLATLLGLATYSNVFVKITGVPTLSHERYPYADIWPALHRVFAAFGLGRCMWGTDWTRTTELLSYDDALRCFTETHELSDGEKAQLLGTTLRTIFRWPAELSPLA